MANLSEMMERCKSLGEKRVSEIMSRDVVCVREDSSFLEFITDIEMYNYMAFPVVNEKDEIVGIISQTDLLKLILFYGPTGTRILKDEFFTGIPSIRSVMSLHPITLKPDDRITEAASLIFEHGIASIPVVEGKKVVGIVGKYDIIVEVLKTAGL
jgi:CBS domain-containing protein